MKQKINSIQEAVPIVCELVRKKTQDQIFRVAPVNRMRHYVITTGRGLKYWMLFKREFFLSFGKIFGFNGCGDSVNAKFVGQALNQKVDGFLFVYRNGYVYHISPREVFDFGKKFNTVRTTKSSERTYSFPLPVERRWR